MSADETLIPAAGVLLLEKLPDEPEGQKMDTIIKIRLNGEPGEINELPQNQRMLPRLTKVRDRGASSHPEFMV
jgi:hypothetical protein